MEIPKGFDSLVKIAMKERPERPKTAGDILDKFLNIVFLGGNRSDAEVKFLINMLKQKKVLGLDHVKETDGEDWRDEVTRIIDERSARIKDEEIKDMLAAVKKEIFILSASIKGGARFFKKNDISPDALADMLSTKEKAWKFIEDLANDQDVTNIKYTKIILWLHSIGFAQDFCPPTRQTKSFINDVFGYYQFYEDDKYFMKKAEEFSADVGKRVKGCTARDVATAIFFYVTLKNMMPQRSYEKKHFTPDTAVKFLRSKKLTLARLSERLSDFEDRLELIDDINKFVRKIK